MGLFAPRSPVIGNVGVDRAFRARVSAGRTDAPIPTPSSPEGDGLFTAVDERGLGLARVKVKRGRFTRRNAFQMFDVERFSMGLVSPPNP
jgi:hypothetical protein